MGLEICLKDLKEQYMRGAGLTVSEPVVSYCEGIAGKTGGMKEDGSGNYPEMMVAKSPNKHNRLYMWGEPMGEDLCKAIDENDSWQRNTIGTLARRERSGLSVFLQMAFQTQS